MLKALRSVSPPNIYASHTPMVFEDRGHFGHFHLFEGEDDSKVAAHNMAALEAQVFRHIGQMIAVSIMHGGPGPQCLSHAVVDYLT